MFKARGHVNVRALHRTTFEVTKEDYLTERGDCIVGVSSEAAAADLPGWLKEWLRSGGPVVAVLSAGGFVDAVAGWGDPRMTLSDPVRMVFRRSTYVGPETVMVRASKAARGIERGLVEALRRGAELTVAIAPLNLDVDGVD
ncbi:DUF371 domain-containing protein [Stetteria hydrogenophila]